MLLLPCRRPENISSPCLGTFKITYKDEKNPVALLLKLNGPIMVTCITDEDMKVTFSPAEVDRMRRTLIFMTQAARTIWFVSTDIFKNKIGNTYCPPKTESKVRYELLTGRQRKRDTHAYAQHIHHLASQITDNTVHEHTLVTVCMPPTLEQAIPWRNKNTSIWNRLPSTRSHIVPRDDRRSEVQNRLTSITWKAKAINLGYKRLYKCNRC